MTCKDCLPGSRRPAPYPGPRCATHHRARKRAAKIAAHGRRLQIVYSITAAEYARILAVQGGVCAICRRATGSYKKLSVDHDHACCDSDRSCGKCVRGLLCQPCNRMLGHLRDDPTAFRRAAHYLEHWPSRS